MENPNTRRQFLKNTSLAVLGSALLPAVLKADSPIESDAVAACDPTTLDFYGEGPFYTANPPNIQNNKLSATNEPGTPLVISGRVMNLDCTQAIPNAVIDVWHANDAGAYDNTGYNLRGKTTSNAQGFYMFETIKPGKYLNGNQFRPSHIHFKITAPGYPTLTTQLYFQGDTSIAADAAASIASGQYDATSRIIPLTLNNGKEEGTWDIVVDGTGPSIGMEDLHINNGMIYNVSPNPFSDRLEIYYGVFRDAKVGLSVYDLAGNLVAELYQKTLAPEKYTAVWQPDLGLPNGHYFVSLKMNDLQVHYLKVIKQSSYSSGY